MGCCCRRNYWVAAVTLTNPGMDEERLTVQGVATRAKVLAAVVPCCVGVLCCAVPIRIGMKEAKIIAKIENMEGLVNYREIMDECNVMLLSRGSMGNCVDPEKMFLAQKMLLRVGHAVQMASKAIEFANSTYKLCVVGVRQLCSHSANSTYKICVG